MQNILTDTLNELTRTELAGLIDLWELDLAHFGGKRYLFCNEKNARGKRWCGKNDDIVPIPYVSKIVKCGAVVQLRGLPWLYQTFMAL